MVIKTLKDLSEDRKAYRFINGVLVEKTVGAVLPDTEGNAEQVRYLPTRPRPTPPLSHRLDHPS